MFIRLKSKVDEDNNSIIDRIRSVCTTVATKLGKELNDDMQFSLDLKGDTYWGTFKVSGSSGEVVYKTPLFKAWDEVYMDEDTVWDYNEYCSTIFEKLDEIANEEY